MRLMPPQVRGCGKRMRMRCDVCWCLLVLVVVLLLLLAAMLLLLTPLPCWWVPFGLPCMPMACHWAGHSGVRHSIAPRCCRSLTSCRKASGGVHAE